MQHQGGPGGAPGKRPPPPAQAIPGVQNIIAVASGKGGVGKSTVTVNFALALASKGYRVGILDADIYGLSIPRMLNLSGQPTVTENKMLAPLMNYGVKCMSIGFFVPDDSPAMWRGPMVQSALDQMIRKVAWGVLDYLVVDMPPGTGEFRLIAVPPPLH